MSEAAARAGVTSGAAARAVHIRHRASKARRGNQFYKPDWDDQDPQRETLCGAPAGPDMSWSETRWAKYLAFVTCEKCRDLRAR